MSTTSIFKEYGELTEHGLVKELSIPEDNKKSVKRRKLDHASQETVFKLISSFLVILAGLAGYWVAGLL
jgi:hypothetical protein